MKAAIARFVSGKQEVTVGEILEGIGLKGRGKAAEMRVANALRELGWTKVGQQMRQGVRSVYWSRPANNDKQALIVQKAGPFDYESMVNGWPREVMVRLLAKYIRRELEAPYHWSVLMEGPNDGPAN